jgi:hypothetical protein
MLKLRLRKVLLFHALGSPFRVRLADAAFQLRYGIRPLSKLYRLGTQMDAPA